MAKYDQGGGCPCGLQKVCDCDHAERREVIAASVRRELGLPETEPTWGPKVGDGLSLGSRLAATISALEAANIKHLSEQAAADIAVVERERADIAHYVAGIRASITQRIEAGKVPAIKVKEYARQDWLRAAENGKAKYQTYWTEFKAWLTGEGLAVRLIEEHDGCGMSNWITLTVVPNPETMYKS